MVTLSGLFMEIVRILYQFRQTTPQVWVFWFKPTAFHLFSVHFTQGDRTRHHPKDPIPLLLFPPRSSSHLIKDAVVLSRSPLKRECGFLPVTCPQNFASYCSFCREVSRAFVITAFLSLSRYCYLDAYFWGGTQEISFMSS